MFLDFRKAFDTVNHKVLIRKLIHYGMRELPFDWFKSYQTNRQQKTSKKVYFLIPYRFHMVYHKGIHWAPLYL